MQYFLEISIFELDSDFDKYKRISKQVKKNDVSFTVIVLLE